MRNRLIERIEVDPSQTAGLVEARREEIDVRSARFQLRETPRLSRHFSPNLGTGETAVEEIGVVSVDNREATGRNASSRNSLTRAVFSRLDSTLRTLLSVR